MRGQPCWVLWLFVVGMATLGLAITTKIQPLQPIQAVLVGRFVSQPSGLTFCNITEHLYMICDTPQCQYIYEVDRAGNLVRLLDGNSLFIPKDLLFSPVRAPL